MLYIFINYNSNLNETTVYINKKKSCMIRASLLFELVLYIYLSMTLYSVKFF